LSEEPEILEDIQSSADRREVPLQKVGIKDIEMPFMIKCMGAGHQTVLANVMLSADLPHYFKGTHMSRFVEILEEWRNRPVSGPEIKTILQQTRSMLSSDTAAVDVRYKYFIEKQAPVSKFKSTMGYMSSFSGALSSERFDFRLGVEVPITTVCPCSKAIAEEGAHNQRALIRAKLRFTHGSFMWIEEVVRLLESQGSMDIFPLLKREDEKFVTEQAFRNPKFVEDVVRDCVVALRKEPRLRWFSVECESYESIHEHTAFASFEESV